MTGARRWPLVVIGSSPFVAVWSGWVGLGGMTGFGVVRPLPGIWDGLTLDTAITLPIGVEAYAVYALAVATSPKEMPAAVRRFAWASAAASLALGMGGQVAFHVMTAHGVSAAPWWVTALVSCLPVLVIFAAAVLWHLTARIGQVSEQAPVTVTAPVMTAEPVPAAVMPAPVSPAVTKPVPGTRAAPARSRALDIDDLVLPAQAVAQDLVRAGQKVNRATLAAGLRDRRLACSTEKAQLLMPLVRKQLEKTA